MHLKGRKTNTIDIGLLWSSKHCYNNKSNYCLCNSHQVFLSTESERYLQLQISLEDQPYSTTTVLIIYMSHSPPLI